MRRRLREIADADAAEAPARLAFGTGPEGDRHRRYELTHERMVARRIDQFINIRIKGASGAFDPADISWQDLLGTAPLGMAQPRAEARPVVEPAGDAGRDSRHHGEQVFLAEVNDSGHRENDGRESPNDAPPAHLERTLLDAIPEFERVYDEPTILRNEAIVSVVSCQSSVVPCEVGPINEANVSVVSRPLSLAKLTRSTKRMCPLSVVSRRLSVRKLTRSTKRTCPLSVVSRRLSAPKRRVNRHGRPRAPSRAPVRPIAASRR